MGDTSTAELHAKYSVPNYGRFPVSFVRGEGARLWDEDGKEYLDFGAGIAVDTLGHAHPVMIDALASQSKELIHCSNLYHIRPQAELARELTETVMGQAGKCLFCNSGAEANEALIKLARKFGHRRPQADGTPRTEILTFSGSFHGRTMAGISATAQQKVKDEFGPLLPGFTHLPTNDVEALKAAVGPQTVAILIEPIQGEGGIHVARGEFLRAAADLANEHDLLLLFDEVQCGIGRAGEMCGWHAIEGAEDIVPDGVSWAKGMGGGFPIGAVWIRERDLGGDDGKLCCLLGPGTHGTTYGGSPLASAVSLAVIREVQSAGLCENANTLGDYIRSTVGGWDLPLVREIRGHGLMIGFEIDAESLGDKDTFAATGKMVSIYLVTKLFDRGLLTVPAGADVVRWLPPLNITREDADKALAIFESVLRELS
ncbi:MAG: aspartate aminotransferase family protein [Verrucomicrobiota bacterium]